LEAKKTQGEGLPKDDLRHILNTDEQVKVARKDELIKKIEELSIASQET
jgi:hypothetical protein